MKRNLPKVGKVVLVLCAGSLADERIYHVAWRVKTKYFPAKKCPDGYIYEKWKSCFKRTVDNVHLRNVTHWMELPLTYSDGVQPVEI